MSIFVWNGSCCPIQNNIQKKQNAMKLKFTYFPVIKNTIKRNAFKKNIRFMYNFPVFFICQHSCRIYVLCAHFLSFEGTSRVCGRSLTLASMCFLYVFVQNTTVICIYFKVNSQLIWCIQDYSYVTFGTPVRVENQTLEVKYMSFIQ